MAVGRPLPAEMRPRVLFRTARLVIRRFTDAHHDMESRCDGCGLGLSSLAARLRLPITSANVAFGRPNWTFANAIERCTQRTGGRQRRPVLCDGAICRAPSVSAEATRTYSVVFGIFSVLGSDAAKPLSRPNRRPAGSDKAVRASSMRI